MPTGPDDTRLREICRHHSLAFRWRTWQNGERWYAEIRTWRGGEPAKWVGSNGIGSENQVFDFVVGLLLDELTRVQRVESIHMTNPLKQTFGPADED